MAELHFVQLDYIQSTLYMRGQMSQGPLGASWEQTGSKLGAVALAGDDSTFMPESLMG